MSNWLKNNKKKVIVTSIVLIAFILFVVFLVSIINFLMPDTKASVYGDRCEVTADYPINDEKEKEIESFINEYDKIKFVSFKVKCNLIDIVVEVDDKENFKTVKEMGKKLLSKFSKEELEHYDIELMVRSNNEESQDFPQIGTHHKKINDSMNNDFVW